MIEREVAYPKAKEHRGPGYLLEMGDCGKSREKKRPKINIPTNYPFPLKLKKSWYTLVAQLVMHPTLHFSPSHVLMVVKSSPALSSVLSMEPA